MIRRILYLSLTALLGLLLLFLAFYRPTPKPVHCQGVSVDIRSAGTHSFIKEQDVLSELRELQGDVVGVPVDSINTLSLEKQFKSNGLFSNVNLFFTPRGMLHVSIEQRDPFFAVYENSGAAYYVAVDRSIIPINVSQKYFLHLLPVSGSLDRSFATGPLYDLLSLIAEDAYWNDFFIHFYIDPRLGIIAVSRVGPSTIILGKTPQWEDKLENLKLFIRKAIPKFGWSNIKSINLDYEGQVVVVPKGLFRELYPLPEKPVDIVE